MSAQQEPLDPPGLGEPPPSPELPRRVRLYRAQWVGIPILVLVPVVALFGVFDEQRTILESRTAELAIQVEYPTRTRARQTVAIQVQLQNRSGRTLDAVGVAFDTAFLDRFSELEFSPGVRHAYVVDLAALPPGESRPVRVTGRAERYGRHGGELAVFAGADTARVRLSTFILP